MLKTSRQPVAIQTVKSRLAQLLAQENIKVQHLPVKTASFDMKNRVLTCPIWKDMDGDVYDLCMGHEVGHALNTPLEGWHGALKQMGKGYQSYMNVCEDARIERKIKQTYPGLRAAFARAYIKLDQQDIFEIRRRRINIDKLALIDRLNLHFKMGHIYPVKFTAEESTFITRLEKAETWEQVRAIADELYQRAKQKKDKLPQTAQQGTPETGDDEQEGEEKQKQKKSKKDKQPKQDEDEQSESDAGDKDSDASDEDGEEGDSDGDSETDELDYSDDGDDAEDDESGADTDAEEDERAEEEDSAANEDQDDEDSEASGLGANSDDDGEEDDDSADADEDTKADDGEEDEPQGNGEERKDFIHNHENDVEVTDPISETDEAFRKNEENLVDEQATGIRTCYLPETKNVDKMIYPIQSIVGDIERGIRKGFDEYQIHNGKAFSGTPEQFAALSVADLIKNNKKYVDLLVKEFELRKNATDYARQLTAKTGELDTNNLHKYRFTNDLFKKITNVPKGKSHGMVFFLDMSSSMQPIMGHTVKQLLVLLMFCKRVQIPFEVYGFADGTCNNFTPGRFQWAPDTIQCDDRRFHLKHLMSSRLQGNMYRRAFAALAMYSNIFYNNQSEAISNFLHPSYDVSVSFSEWDMNMILNGTPYNKMLLASLPIIQNFRAETQVDICNVIHLTDGEGTDPCNAYNTGIDYNDPNYRALSNSRIAYTDRKTQLSIIEDFRNGMSGSQTVLTCLVKKITGARHIAYYVGDDFNIKQMVTQVCDKGDDRNAARESLRTYGFFKKATLGYDSYYYMLVQGNNTNIQISDNESKKIADRFVDFQREKAKSRMLAKQFASELAEQIKRTA